MSMPLCYSIKTTRRWPVQARVAAIEFQEFPWHLHLIHIQNIVTCKIMNKRMRLNWLRLNIMLKIFQKYLLYRKLEFSHSSADVLINNIKWTEHERYNEVNIEKILIIFYFLGHIHVGILCRIPFRVVYPTLFIDLKHPKFCRFKFSCFY